MQALIDFSLSLFLTHSHTHTHARTHIHVHSLPNTWKKITNTTTPPDRHLQAIMVHNIVHTHTVQAHTSIALSIRGSAQHHVKLHVQRKFLQNWFFILHHAFCYHLLLALLCLDSPDDFCLWSFFLESDLEWKTYKIHDETMYMYMDVKNVFM